LRTEWATQDIGQGFGALDWLVGDIDNDGQAELLQPWNNRNRLGLIVYGWDGTQMTTKWSSSNMRQGSGALAWLVADIDGDGKSELLQLWNNPNRKKNLRLGGLSEGRFDTNWTARAQEHAGHKHVFVGRP
jgi:hypothetical protein